MPIMSVRYLVRKGCSVKFFLGGGEIHFPDGKVLPFVEMQGVFFIGLDVKQPIDIDEDDSDVDMPDFIRPGQ